MSIRGINNDPGKPFDGQHGEQKGPLLFHVANGIGVLPPRDGQHWGERRRRMALEDVAGEWRLLQGAGSACGAFASENLLLGRGARPGRFLR